MNVVAQDPRAFIKALGLRDVVLMTIVAVVSLRWIPFAARAGAASLTLWLLACAAFFVPLATALVLLGRRYPDQGGLYVWTRRAFGPRHGFVCGWCLWVNNLFYFPSLLLFGAANALALGGPSWQTLADNHAYSIAFVLAGIWLTVAINIVGLSSGKWVQNVGTAGVWIPAGLLIGAGVIALATAGSATHFGARDLFSPAGADTLGTLTLWSAMCFAFSGFEITSYVGQEVKDPERTLPRGVLIAGALISAIYILGSAAVLIAIPADALHDRSGITDAVDLVASRLDLPALGGVTGGLLAVAAFAGTFSWMAGSARVPFAAGVDRAMPAWLGRLHPRYRTPHLALLVQGAVSSGIFLASVFLTIRGNRSSIREAYDVLVNLSILVYFIPYVYLFGAVPKLAGQASPAVRLAMAAGLGATLGSIALLFVPPAGTQHALNYAVSILVQSALVLLSGLFFYRRASLDGGASGSSSTPAAGRG